jgi:hypothetical protein
MLTNNNTVEGEKMIALRHTLPRGSSGQRTGAKKYLCFTKENLIIENRKIKNPMHHIGFFILLFLLGF